MHLLDPLGRDYHLLSEIFEKIYQKNAIAFLGAGASVTDLRFLSKDIIEYYEGRINKRFGTQDIIKFVDILQSTPGLRRADFDKFVIDQLLKLEPTEGHNIFVTIPWKQIITTNYDTLIEEASDWAIKNNKTHLSIKTIRDKRQFDFQTGNNEIPFIKLNGCKTDLSSYPLVFSSEDFKRQYPFYKKVLSPFKQFSLDIAFIAFGYSFSDDFSEKLLEKIESTDFRQKRLLYCVDPFVNDDRLAYFETKDISMIKISFDEFFNSYQAWYENNQKSYLKNLQRFTNPNSSAIKITTNARIYLDGNLIQMKDDTRHGEKISKIDFYTGTEPSFQVVVDDYDVLKKNELNKLLDTFKSSFDEHTKTSVPKFIIINGDFGTGKTTFTLRAIKEYLKSDSDTLAFEITKSLGFKKSYLAQLIKDSEATKFIFYCDNIETDSVFKSFNELRVDIATEQYSNISIVFISSIRANILERFKNSNKIVIKNSVEFGFKAKYTNDELGELVDNLKEVNLLNYRDLEEKNQLYIP